MMILISADQWGRAWLPFEGERSTSWPSEELQRLPPIWHNDDDGEEDDYDDGEEDDDDDDGEEDGVDDGDENTTNLRQW